MILYSFSTKGCISDFFMNKIGKIILISISSFLLVSVVLICCVIIPVVGKGRMLHPTPELMYMFPHDKGMTYENVTITAADDVDLKAWWIESKNSTHPNSNITLIVLHGFSHSKAWMLDHYGDGFYNSNYRMLFIDSRNRGESEITELGVTWGIDEVKDLRAAVDFVKAQPEVNDSQVAIFAESQGAATLLFYTAEYNDVAAIIPDSSWSEGKAMIKQAYPMRAGFPWFIFGQITVKLLERHFGFTFEEISPINEVPSITTPTYLIHGDADLDINYEDSQDIFDAIPGTTPKQLWITSGRGHVMSYLEPNYFSNIETFITSVINGIPL